MGELIINVAAPELTILSLLFQFWVVQSPLHASERKKSDVASALVAFAIFEMTAGAAVEAAMLL